MTRCFCYIVECADGTYYTGWAVDPEKRVKVHNAGRGAKYTKMRLPVKLVSRTVIFGAYDNIIARFGAFGRILRGILQFLEKTPLKFFGLSHFWVVEKLQAP